MGINRVDHAAIEVNDLDAGLQWYEEVLGLRVLDRSEGGAHLACSGDRADLTLKVGGHGLVTFAMGADSADDLDAVESRLRERGLNFERIKDPDRPGTAELTRFALPSGQQMEVAIADGGHTAGETISEWDGKSHTPTDIDHVNLLGVEDPMIVGEFLRDVVGMQPCLSMQAGEVWLAMWARSGRLDHDVAYMRAVRETDRLHHVAFAMVDGNHYYALADRLAQAQARFEFGPGRHGGGGPGAVDGFGTNLFAYAFDPSGNRNEFSGGMLEYPEDAPMVSVQAPADLGDVMNLWAPNMPESFMTVGS